MPKFLSTAKGKFLTVASAASVFAMTAAAKVTMNEQGAVSGDFEMGTFNGLAVAVLAALGAMWIVKKALSLVK